MTWLFWAPLAAASLHIFEEFAYPGQFAQWYVKYKPEITRSVTRKFLVIINVLLLVLCYDVGALGPGDFGTPLWLGVMALLGANGLWHLRGALKTRSYSPGVLTGTLLYLPLAVYGYVYFLQSKQVSIPVAIVEFAIGASYQLWSNLFHRIRAAAAGSRWKLTATTKWIAGGIVLLVLAFLSMKLNTFRLMYYESRLTHAKRELFDFEKQGKAYRPAYEILYEAKWIGNSTHDLARLGEHVNALEAVLQDTSNSNAKDEQSEIDGSWGKWYSEWFFKLDASYDQISDLASRSMVPKYPARFLDRINSPEKLVEHLNHLLISDLDAEGVDRRRELNETVADLTRLIMREQPKNYAYDPGLKAALLDWLINTARNPETGYWGARYRQNDGTILKTDDLSVTFHIVSYLEGRVPDWPKIIATTLAIKDKSYPYGWLEGSVYLNHNNMDVVKLFRLGWSQATPSQHDAMRVEIRKMLRWCLNESLQPDGSFRLQDSDDSMETSIAFGTSFLSALGYFDRSKRFWTDEDFPEAATNREHIIQFIRAHIHSGGEGGVYYRDTLKELGASVSE